MYRGQNIRTFAPPELKSFNLNQFLGVDFTKGDYISDARRSPDALNTVWGNNPFVFDTRPGIKRVFTDKLIDTSNEGKPINGIHIYEPLGEILIHAKTDLYKITGTATEIKDGEAETTLLYTGLEARATQSFMMNGILYIIGGGLYLQYDGVIVTEVVGFIPTTVINRLPSGGGVAFEAVNLISAYRKNSFRAESIPQEIVDTYTADGTETEFSLTTTTNITYDEIVVTVDSNIKQAVVDYIVDRINAKITFLVAPTNLSSVEITYYAEDPDSLVWETEYFLDSTDLDEEDITVIVNGVELDETTDFSVDYALGKVTFASAPKSEIGGVDNVIITFSKAVAGYADLINDCTIFGIFGGKNDTRVFLTGNADYPNKDWQSGLYDATYFPDTGFTLIGADNTAIKGYIKQYDTQMIIKEGNQQDGSAFLRVFGLDAESKPVFPVEQGAVGIGAISSRSFAYIQGEPLFLSSQGVVGVQGTNVDNQRLIQDKSELINSVLTNEFNLQNAIGVEHENKYYLFINGKVFVCDARMRYTDPLGNVQYEWMYWATIRADSVKSYSFNGNSYLLIGYNGILFRLKSPTEFAAFIDEDELGNLSNIETYWTTPVLYFGSISVRKSLADIYILFSKRNRIKVKIEAIVDGSRTVQLGSYDKSGLLAFSDLDFASFSFDSFHATFTFKQRAALQRFDNIQFKIIKETNGTISNLSFGIEVFQATYQHLNH